MEESRRKEREVKRKREKYHGITSHLRGHMYTSHSFARITECLAVNDHQPTSNNDPVPKVKTLYITKKNYNNCYLYNTISINNA